MQHLEEPSWGNRSPGHSREGYTWPRPCPALLLSTTRQRPVACSQAIFFCLGTWGPTTRDPRSGTFCDGVCPPARAHAGVGVGSEMNPSAVTSRHVVTAAAMKLTLHRGSDHPTLQHSAPLLSTRHAVACVDDTHSSSTALRANYERTESAEDKRRAQHLRGGRSPASRPPHTRVQSTPIRASTVCSPESIVARRP